MLYSNLIRSNRELSQAVRGRKQWHGVCSEQEPGMDNIDAKKDEQKEAAREGRQRERYDQDFDSNSILDVDPSCIGC